MTTAFVTGASGYVGARLVPQLLSAGVKVRVLARTPQKLTPAPWREQVEVIQGSVGDDLTEALAGVAVAVYLVHSIGQGTDWATREIEDATSFARCCAAAGVRRIVYLGGLGNPSDELSPHLRSRQGVGQALASHGAEVVELRAGMILGSGSASFEMLRYLVDTLPVMVTPKWVGTRGQPLAIADVLRYLETAITSTAVPAGVYEIGGPDVVTYSELMQLYGDVAGLPKRRLIPVPVLTPGLSAHWVGLVTPVPATLASELVESLVNEVVVTDDKARRVFEFEPMPLREAIERALAAERGGRVPSRFTDADLRVFKRVPTDPDWAGGTVLRDTRSRETDLPAAAVFDAVKRVGGEHGWYGGSWLWRVRGWLDLVAGGPGLRRGRRDPAELREGEPLDFWRVEQLEPGRLRLRAEMLLPGSAWLTFDVDPTEHGSRVTQVAEFHPRGLSGRLYWYAVAPFHRFVFPGLLRGIERDARQSADVGQ